MVVKLIKYIWNTRYRQGRQGLKFCITLVGINIQKYLSFKKSKGSLHFPNTMSIMNLPDENTSAIPICIVYERVLYEHNYYDIHSLSRQKIKYIVVVQVQRLNMILTQIFSIQKQSLSLSALKSPFLLAFFLKWPWSSGKKNACISQSSEVELICGTFIPTYILNNNNLLSTNTWSLTPTRNTPSIN